jgi:hypothetical protein
MVVCSETQRKVACVFVLINAQRRRSMRGKISVFVVVLLLSVFTAISQVHAGWLMKEANGDETFVSDGKMKSNWQAGGMILNGNTGTLIMYDDQKKMYTEGSVEEFCEFATSMFEKMMEQIPPEQREMMKKMMGGSGDSSPPEVVVTKQGEGKKIAGFSTDKYDVVVNGDLYEEVWIATDKGLSEDFRPLMGFIADVTACVGSIGMIGEITPEATDEYAELFKAGVMLKVTSHEEGSQDKGMDVTSLEKTDVSESVFKAPDGYRKVEFGELMNVEME